MVYDIGSQTSWNTMPWDGKQVSGWVRDGWWKYGRIPLYESTTFHILYDLEIDPTEENNIAYEFPDRLQNMKALFDKLAATAVPADEPPLATSLGWGKQYNSGWCNESQLYYDPCTSGPCANY